MTSEDRESKQNERPANGRDARETYAALFGGGGTPASVEIDDGGGGKRVQRCAEVRHGSRKNGGDQQPTDAMRQFRHHEGREDRIAPREWNHWRIEIIENKQRCTHQQEQSELRQHGESAGDQGDLRLTFIASGQQTLHDELIGAVGGGGEEGPSYDAGPKRIGGVEVPGEIEDAELAGLTADALHCAPSSGQKMEDGEQADECAHDVDRELHHVG